MYLISNTTLKRQTTVGVWHNQCPLYSCDVLQRSSEQNILESDDGYSLAKGSHHPGVTSVPVILIIRSIGSENDGSKFCIVKQSGLVGEDPGFGDGLEEACVVGGVGVLDVGEGLVGGFPHLGLHLLEFGQVYGHTGRLLVTRLHRRHELAFNKKDNTSYQFFSR